MTFFSAKEPLEKNYNLNYEIDQSNGNILYIQGDSTVTPLFLLRNKYDYKKSIKPQIKSFSENKKLIQLNDNLYTILEVIQRTNFGATIKKNFHDLENTIFDHQSVQGMFEFSSFDHGTIISFNENIFTDLDCFLSINRNNKLYKYPLSLLQKHG